MCLMVQVHRVKYTLARSIARQVIESEKGLVLDVEVKV
ncbi:MAG: hypothetical protein ACI9ES_002170 [Oceanospirillaceae bacterium]|jgi:hypothetical protein